MATAQGLVRFDEDGQIEAGLAERWIVSDDGLTLDFRIARLKWSNGHAVTAAEVVQSLKQSLATAPQGRLGHLFSAVDEVVAMTARVIEIRLKSPRPHILELLAQPEFSIRHNGLGSGPLQIRKTVRGVQYLREAPNQLMQDDQDTPDDTARTDIAVSSQSAAFASARFVRGDTDAVLGGDFNAYQVTQTAHVPQQAIITDPVNGLFGLGFVGHSSLIQSADTRRALGAMIDRTALAQALNLPKWQTRETVLPAQLDSAAAPVSAEWSATDRASKMARVTAYFASWAKLHHTMPTLRIALPDGPGAKMLFAVIAAQWQTLGVRAVSVRPSAPADVVLIDEVAPNASVNWYFSRLSCASGLVCDSKAEVDLRAARKAQTLTARAQAYAKLDVDMAANDVFIPLGNPFRWNLTSARVPGLHSSATGVHPLDKLMGAKTR